VVMARRTKKGGGGGVMSRLCTLAKRRGGAGCACHRSVLSMFIKPEASVRETRESRLAYQVRAGRRETFTEAVTAARWQQARSEGGELMKAER